MRGRVRSLRSRVLPPVAKDRGMRERRLASTLLAGVLLAAMPASAEQKRPTDGPSVPSLKLDGRLHLQHDAFDGIYSEDGTRRSATYSRRARLGASGRLPWRLRYAVDVDFEPGGRTFLKTAALGWGGLPVGTLRIGRFDPDFGFEQAISSNWTTAIERSAIWDLSADIADIGKGLGLQFDHAAQRWYGSAGAFDGEQSRGIVARAAFTPIAGAQRIVHLGLSLASEKLDDDDGQLRSRLGVRGVSEHDRGNRVTLARDLDGSARYARHRLVGLEFAAAAGPWSVQAEALQRRLSGGAPARRARGHYVQLAWTLTGESRPYEIDGAKFGRIEAANRRLGAWELFARHDWLDVRGQPGLLDGGRDRGRAQVRVFGVNWYARDWLRLAANVVHARTDGIVNDVDDDVGDALSLRLQMVY